MKGQIRLLAIAFMPLAGALFAQDITGTWQGTIHTNKDFREVLKISRDGNALKAVLFSIDKLPELNLDTQPGQSFASPSVTFQGKAVRMQFPGIGGAYQGLLSADGKSIAGSLSQNGTALTLNLVRATEQTAWEIPAPPLPERPTAADANPSFEVATIKPTLPGTQGGGLGPSPGGRFTAHNITLGSLIGFAYGLNRNRIENAPAWLDTDRFDIAAKADMAGTPNKAQVAEMLQKLLADRLSLRFHHEKKERTVYALTVQNSGSRLTPTTSDPNAQSPGGMTRQPGHWHVTALNVDMETFAAGLQGNVLDQPVIDQTGLSGRFDITLDWAPNEVANPVPDNDSSFPDLFTALKNQLGLKLESTKGLIDILVIDHVEKPSEN
jgi:uncharacterized protein (TIGR03435 family)